MSRMLVLGSLLIIGMLFLGCVRVPEKIQPLPLAFSAKQCPEQKQCEPPSPKISAHVLNAPIYTTLGGKPTLFYEVFISNYSNSSPKLHKVEVVESGSGKVLTVVSGEELGKSLRAPMPNSHMDDYMLLLMVELQDGDKPVAISHKFYFDNTIMESGKANINYTKPITIAPPLYGEGWLAAQAPSNFNHHRFGFFGIVGAPNTPGVSQRYAVDWIRYGANGKIYSDDPYKNEDYFCYGQEIHAVADGEIVDTKDQVPDNTPWSSPPITVTWAGGNYAMEQIANGTYAFYAHMIPGSLKVKIGDKVKKGDVLGLLGNSGNSDAPHLHFHIATSKDALFAEGLPYMFESYEFEGNQDWLATMQNDSTFKSTGKKTIVNSMPVDNDVVTLAQPMN